MNKLTAILMSVAMAGLLSTAGTAGAEVIAHWRFGDDTDIYTDSSGNGHTLQSWTGYVPASVADVGDSTGGNTYSALFNGDDDVMGTVSNLDLSSYDYIRVSWWMKVTDENCGVIYEQSVNYGSNDGAIASFANATAGNGQAGVKTDAGFNTDNYTHATDGTWQYFEVEYDIRTGTAAADIVVVNPAGTAGSQAIDTVPFLNDALYIGCRASGHPGNGLGFKGNIDELKIEAIPEPATMTLLLLGLPLALRRRRK